MIQPLHHRLVRTLLRGKDIGGAIRTIQRIFHVAHDCDTNARQQFFRLGDIEVPNISQSPAHWDECISVLAIETCSQSRGAPAAAVVGGAAADPQQDVFAAVFHRVKDYLPYAVSSRRRRIAMVPGQRAVRRAAAISITARLSFRA